MSRALRFVPLAVLLVFLAVIAWRLVNPADPTIRSRLEGRPVPAFALPAAVPGLPGLASSDLAGGTPRLVNIFASWCAPCKAEVRELEKLRARGVPVDGIAVRDRPQDLARFLAEFGNPYERIGADNESRVQIALGSAGVPESFVVDGRGVIRYQHIGPIEPDDVPTILNEIGKAR